MIAFIFINALIDCGKEMPDTDKVRVSKLLGGLHNVVISLLGGGLNVNAGFFQKPE